MRFISKSVVDKQDREVGISQKQNGHPVPPGSIGFNCKEKLYTKETCDVRAHYSTLLPFPSNENCQSIGGSQCCKRSDRRRAGQEISADMHTMWPESFRRSQLDKAYGTRSESCFRMGVDLLSVPQGALCKLPGHPYRGSGFVPPLSSCHDPASQVRL